MLDLKKCKNLIFFFVEKILLKKYCFKMFQKTGEDLFKIGAQK